MNQITLTGMVLSAGPMGEYDRRVVLLTKERGKISAFAKGARRPDSALVGVTQPFSFGEFTLYEGRTSYNLVNAKISNYFEELRSDVEGAYYGFYFMDFAGFYTREGVNETETLKLLYQSFRALLKPQFDNRLVRAIFELKLVTIHGEGPLVFSCLKCGSTEGELQFSVRKGGLLCSSCRKKLPEVTDSCALLPSALYTMQYIVATPIEKLYQFTVTEEVLSELQDILKKYLERYVNRDFKSLEILETILRR